jgi:4-amino-4-deoxy-L-arabinose transferase-like glycosyltransferase
VGWVFPGLRRGEGRPLLLLWLLAVLLALTGLGDPPLRDWDEGIVARVALEASRLPWPQDLLPQYWGDPYLNKPPGIHLVIAALIGLWRQISGAPAAALPPEWVLRLGPALLASTIVPLLGLVQGRLRPGDGPAVLATAAMALTLLPLARHGRLVMLDGSLLSAMALLWWGLLLADRKLVRAWWGGLLAGLAVSLLLLLKAPAAPPLLIGALALRLLERDLTRRSVLGLGLGLMAGMLPGLAWHGWHLLERGPDALQMWFGQGYARLGSALEGHSGGPLPPLLEVLEGGWPWLPLWPFGIGLAWWQRRQRAGLWTLGLTLISAALVLPLRTQLPWYSLLLWPPFVLVCAPVLAWLVHRRAADTPPWPGLAARVPAFWSCLGAVLLLAALLGTSQLVPALRAYVPIAVPLGAGLVTGGLALMARDRRRRCGGAALLVGGLWLALIVLMASPFWLWELNESWPVRPVAALLAGRGDGPVLLWRMGTRPSLEWYAQRRLPAVNEAEDLPGPPGAPLWLLARESPDHSAEESPQRARQGARQGGALHCHPEAAIGELRLYLCRRG